MNVIFLLILICGKGVYSAPCLTEPVQEGSNQTISFLIGSPRSESVTWVYESRTDGDMIAAECSVTVGGSLCLDYTLTRFDAQVLTIQDAGLFSYEALLTISHLDKAEDATTWKLFDGNELVEQCDLVITDQEDTVPLSEALPPQVISFQANSMTSSTLEATEGETVTFVCDVMGVPRPSVTLRGQRSNVSIAVQEKILDSNLISFTGERKMSCDATDTYVCIPHGGEQKGTGKSISVFVTCEPKLQSTSNDSNTNLDFETPEGKVFELRFPINSYPPPVNFTLFRAGNMTSSGDSGRRRRAVTKTEVSKDGYQTIYVAGQPPQGTVVLQMFGMSPQRSGQYVLRVDNGMGTGLEISFSVKVNQAKDDDDDDDLGLEAWIGIVTAIIGALGTIIPAAIYIVKKIRTLDHQASAKTNGPSWSNQSHSGHPLVQQSLKDQNTA